MSNLWRRLAHLQGRVPPEPDRHDLDRVTRADIQQAERQVELAKARLRDEGWTEAEIKAAHPEPDMDQLLEELQDEIRRVEAERESSE
jgi:hypothetical protein